MVETADPAEVSRETRVLHGALFDERLAVSVARDDARDTEAKE
jgi:hypothetical protein